MKSKIPEVIFSALIASMPLSFFVWIGIVIHHFQLQRPYAKLLLRMMRGAFSDPKLSWITYGALFGVFALCSLLSYFYHYHSSAGLRSDYHIRGSKILDAKKLKQRIEREEGINKKDKENEKQGKLITLAEIPVPLRLETLHFLIGGRTGTGKTVAIKEMLSRIIPRGDRVIITDPNGDFLSHFWKEKDVVLNPFDLRGEGWSIFNELDSQYDHERYAKSVIPPARSLQDAEWHGYAQLLFAETTKKLFKEKQYTTKALIEWLTLKPVEELARFLSGTAATGLFDPGAAKALASTRFIITHYLAPHQYLKPGTFSLKAWLKNEKENSEKSGNLYITWREDMAEALRPLISTWLDILCTSILSLSPSERRRVWVIIDELASLERLNSLEAALTKGRKHGLRIVTGLQSTAQLDHLYGREKAITLRSCFSNLLILGGTSSDSQTAEDFSKGLGEQDLERIQTSTTQTRQGRNKTESKQRLKERIVLPSEITHLPPLNGYLSLAGDYPIALVTLKPPALHSVTSRFQE